VWTYKVFHLVFSLRRYSGHVSLELGQKVGSASVSGLPSLTFHMCILAYIGAKVKSIDDKSNAIL
jgi:hypothetical protein